MSKKGLGMGLSALFETNSAIETEKEEQGSVFTLRISEIEPNRDQPRKTFDEEALDSLADSIKEHGIIQPLLVERLENGRYRIIAGERRWRAARRAGLREVPVIVKELEPRVAAEISLIENLQREDLNPVEEAMGYRRLMTEYGLTQEVVAQRTAKSRPAVANALRLLNLPEFILADLSQGDISAGHAKALLPLVEKADEATLKALVQRIKAGELTVRKLEQAVKSLLEEKPEKVSVFNDSDRIYLRELERGMEEKFGRKVRITESKKGGRVELDFYGRDDLNKLLDLIYTPKNF